MNASELFKIWAPTTSVWSRWAKPVLFAEMDPSLATAPEINWPRVDIQNENGTAVVVDMPGDESVAIGIALAQDGFRPVPLFNSAAAAGAQKMAFTTVNVSAVQGMLIRGAGKLGAIQLPDNAPPAFLLD